MDKLTAKRPLILRLGFILPFSMFLFLAGSALSSEVITPLLKGPVFRLFPESIAVNVESYFLNFAGIHVVVLLYIFLTRRDVMRRFFSGYRHNTARWFLMGILAGLGTNLLCIGIPFLRGELSFERGNLSFPAGLLLFFCVFVQSSAEELFFRGYLLQYLADGYLSPWVGILASSFLFASGHLFNAGVTVLAFIIILLAGVSQAVMVLYFGSYWFPLAFHTAWNFCQAFLFGLPNSGQSSACSILHFTHAKQSLFYDTSFGVESTLSAALIYAGFIIIEFLILSKKNIIMEESP